MIEAATKTMNLQCMLEISIRWQFTEQPVDMLQCRMNSRWLSQAETSGISL